MTKVLALVTFRIFPANMGGQKSVAIFYEYLQKRMDVLIACPRSGDEKNECLVHLYANKRIWFNVFILGRIKQVIRNAGVQLIIAEHSYPGFLALLLRNVTGRPFIIHSHNIEASRFRQMNRWWWQVYAYYEKWIHQRADFNFFITEADKEYAVHRYKLKEKKCAVVPYGTHLSQLPATTDKAALKKNLGLHPNDLVLYFNGSLDYLPNQEAVEWLVQKLAPALKLRESGYRIYITGKNVPAKLLRLMATQENVLFGGFVSNVDACFMAADLFLNPVKNNAGVKTKLIEAIAHNCTCISFATGAAGMETDHCGDKLIVVPDNDQEQFINAIALHRNCKAQTPPQFYNYYYWNNIASKAAEIITGITRHEPTTS